MITNELKGDPYDMDPNDPRSWQLLPDSDLIVEMELDWLTIGIYPAIGREMTITIKAWEIQSVELDNSDIVFRMERGGSLTIPLHRLGGVSNLDRHEIAHIFTDHLTSLLKWKFTRPMQMAPVVPLASGGTKQ